MWIDFLSSWLFWAILGCILLIIEMFTASFITLFFTIPAFITAMIAFFVKDLSIQIFIFALLGLISIVFGRPILQKHFKVNKTIKHSNIYAIIEKKGIVTKTITADDYGQVRVSGEVWTAKSELGNTIEVGSKVIIKKVEGVKVSVTLDN
ncbi:MAG TPA: NfeD family protein [Peptostreptococcaceae bacterium]|nr:NfeD family protein [Peptostreptococcaceae bacterium]